MSAARELLDAYVATASSDAAVGLAALTTEEAAGVLSEIDPVTAAALLQEMPFAAAARPRMHSLLPRSWPKTIW